MKSFKGDHPAGMDSAPEPLAASALHGLERDPDRLFSTEELAILRSVPASRIEKERLKGDGPPFVRDGHLVRYRLGDYRAWVANLARYTSTADAAAGLSQPPLSALYLCDIESLRRGRE
jgi:hypothetical protein